MYHSVKGTYQNGHVELDEQPHGITASNVIVTFLSNDESAKQEELRERFFQRLERGVDFGDKPIMKRDEIYAERINRFD